VTCPLRFHERLDVFAWAAEEVLSSESAVLIGEVPFLESAGARGGANAEAVGRIDMIVVDEASLSGLRMEWCALETQAVYFSGTGMDSALRAIAAYEGDRLPFPDRVRRPDYRSSAPKRLMPQLQIKVPALRRWGKKMVVVVDRHFFAWMGSLSAVDDITSGDIVWCVVDVVEGPQPDRLMLSRFQTLYTTLGSAVIGLTGGTPVPLNTFEERVRAGLPRGVVLPTAGRDLPSR
jgi:hypothetical protein